jgi:hypothetical protein
MADCLFGNGFVGGFHLFSGCNTAVCWRGMKSSLGKLENLRGPCGQSLDRWIASP